MKKKQIAFNSHLIFMFFLFFVFLRMTIEFAMENEIGFSIVGSILVLIPILFVFMISPLYITFSEESVEIIYNFGQREQILWNDIRSITLRGGWIVGNGFPRYEVAYPRNGKRWFFVDGDIPKTRKTKKLIKMYYKKEIM